MDFESFPYGRIAKRLNLLKFYKNKRANNQDETILFICSFIILYAILA